LTVAAINRIRQGIASLRPTREISDDTLLAEWLSAAQRDAFLELPRHDRAHLRRVGGTMIEQAPGNQELILAAFLHDLGKVSGRFHVRLIDRVAKVLLQAISPSLLRKLATPPPSGIRGGLVLAVHHPEFGAERARALDGSERTCWLIAHHEEASAFNDPELTLLAAIDDATP
jgi:hypothetical protein